jgi:hypothetical protein
MFAATETFSRSIQEFDSDSLFLEPGRPANLGKIIHATGKSRREPEAIPPIVMSGRGL